MLSEVSSTLRVSGALASRSRLGRGQRREGSRERLEPSDVRHSLRRLRRWICSSLACTDLIRGGRCIGGAVKPLCSTCWRPCLNRFKLVCPRPGTSERFVWGGLVARNIRAVSGSTKNGGLCWRRASSSRKRNSRRRTASSRPSKSLAPLT
jgi:hypothetical protein